METLHFIRELRLVAFVSVMTLGSVAGSHPTQDLNVEFQDEASRFVYSKLMQSLPEEDRSQARRITGAVMEAAKERSMDPVFVLAIIQQESHFRIRMIGSVGEIGLMQIRPSTAEWISKRYGISYEGADTLMDPTVNIRLGTAYLGYLKDRFASARHLYVPAYNMGVRGLRQAMNRGARPVVYLNGVESKYRRLVNEARVTTSRI